MNTTHIPSDWQVEAEHIVYFVDFVHFYIHISIQCIYTQTQIKFATAALLVVYHIM